MTAQTALKVTSHVGRDFLQSAQLFRHEHAVVWEYVSNGLQYKDPATKPTVVVEIDPKAKTIKISDNGRGMTMADLQRYFQMHGENLDRKQGRPGRGYFGTGKSAAFGIATSLTITTVRNGRLSKVRLLKKDIDAQADGDEIPVKILTQEAVTSAPNGTVVEIDNILLKQIDIASVIRHIERHIAHWPDASVVVNTHECEFSEPDINREVKVRTVGTEYEQLLGDTTLTIKIAKAPLEDEFRGIAILSAGVWHETTLAGCERKPFADYLFGTFDVPALAQDASGVSAFDMSRSMKLNPRNEVVADILRFVGVNLETVRKELEKQDRERRQSEEQKRLQQQASKIAELINRHFKEWSAKLKNTMAKAGTGRDILPAKERSASEDVAAVFGDELPGVIVGNQQGNDGPGPGPEPDDPPPFLPRVEFLESAPENLAKKAPTVPKNSPAGGFNVAFEKIGINEKRAKYDRDKRTIYINLEHPRIAMELRTASGQLPLDDPNFLRMAYEIAFTEYAIVLAQELSTIQFFLDPQDALVELRQTIDELSKSFATSWPLAAARH
jgi:hypothetical protein